MKINLAKIFLNFLAYCAWFGFILWLSFWFFLLVVRIENWLGIFSGARFPVMVVSWFGFVCISAWVPVWFFRKRWPDMKRFFGASVTFLIMLLGCTVTSTILWDNCVADTLYNCTDSVPFNFLSPGNWIHGNYVTVPRIVTVRSMSEPDTIKEGWSISKLWCLWWSFVAVSVAASGLLTYLIWRSKRELPAFTAKATCAGNAGS